MGNRILKESIRTSKKINSLTDFQFRVWAYLVTYVDDYGRGSADAELLKGFVFPRRRGITEQQIAKTLAELATSGMISLYEVDGESFFCFPTWGEHQRVQQKRSKFPAPREDAQSHGGSRWVTVGHGDPPPESESESISEYESISEGGTRAPARGGFAAPLESAECGKLCGKLEDEAKRSETNEGLSALSTSLRAKVDEWMRYKAERREDYRETGRRHLVSAIAKASRQYGDTAVEALIDECMASGYKGIAFDRLARGSGPKGATSSGSAKKRAVDTATPSSSNIKEFSTWAFQAIYGKEGQDGDQQPQQGQEI